MRESGYYWVRHTNGPWAIAHFEYNSWLVVGSDESFKDEDFDIIGEQIKREIEQ